MDEFRYYLTVEKHVEQDWLQGRGVPVEPDAVQVPAAAEGQPGLVPHGVGQGGLGTAGLLLGVVAELEEGGEHGRDEAAHQDEEDAGHVAQGQLVLAGGLVRVLVAFSVLVPAKKNKGFPKSKFRFPFKLKRIS